MDGLSACFKDCVNTMGMVVLFQELPATGQGAYLAGHSGHMKKDRSGPDFSDTWVLFGIVTSLLKPTSGK